MPAVAPPCGNDILIYAELLTNIRQVTIKASLPTPADHTTTAEILGEGRKFRISHNGTSVEAVLPATAPVKGTLPLSHKGSAELTWRLPLKPARVPERQFLPENQPLPWPASVIKPGSPISCRACRQIFINSAAVTTWKDLPSENWAEMMEFWHCHKPIDHDTPEDGDLQHRGYGAASAITSQPGVGFVDITSFLFAESDCDSIKFSSSNSPGQFNGSQDAIQATKEEKFLTISCSNCTADVGIFSVLASTVAFYKWQISCEISSVQKSPSSSDCLVATLLSTIARSGSSKSVVMPRNMALVDKTMRHLQLWVINNNVIFTSNQKSTPTSAVKVLFKEIGEKEALELVESLSNDVQDVNFPAQAIKVARETLTFSKYMLPSSERSFQEWQVGLLERWVPQPA
ncbi:Ubiquitin-conjugating enzyme E2C-binding protein [Beauveria brongniartii RCEF 3172]|uniref:Ubiquitin-conjugating enzyme E2C-binding protein n=1 Tax=Beauveria brongniartii RCEF 3172 TaxID=1081107 RepID=A0A167FYA4_9HYPO|nr:Ubiquitin-conjugating enzyme E2C-binding protein [Beauveria brongniartii RCEF 3172]